MRAGPERRVLVVGGGPAGLATAIAARRRGLEVLLVDRARPPLDKACGEGLMPDGLAVLDRLGVRADGGARLRGIRYLDGGTIAEEEFASGHGLGIRRPLLHQALVRRAEEAGVEMLWGTAVRALAADGVETARGPLRAGWIVAADGLHSRMRRWAGLDRPPAGRRRFGVRRHYRIVPWTDLVEVHWGDRCEAYVTPVGADEVGVALLWSGEAGGFDRLLGRFPALAERFAGAPVVSRQRGAGPLHQRSRRVWRRRLALVGDAAGYLDAITGEGLAVAFHQAEALAEALDRGDLRRYGCAYRRIVWPPLLLTRLLLVAESRPALRHRLMRTLAGEPGLFARLLAIHTRAVPPSRLGVGRVLRLVRGLVR